MREKTAGKMSALVEGRSSLLKSIHEVVRMVAIFFLL